MSEADDRLRSGDLDGARSALIEGVRRDPVDVPTRMFLFQLLAIRGEWDKAATHLGVLATLSPEAGMLSTVYNQAIAAERERERVFAGAATANVHGGAAWAQGIADAIRLDANGDHGAAATAREAAFDSAPDTTGVLDGEPFDWIADADARFGPCIEAIIGGQYGLLPFEHIAALKSEGPKDLRDIVWYPVEIAMTSGVSIAALLPARYPGVMTEAAELLGRATDWHDGPMGQTGSGQKLWVHGGEGQDRALLSVRSLVTG